MVYRFSRLSLKRESLLSFVLFFVFFLPNVSHSLNASVDTIDYKSIKMGFSRDGSSIVTNDGTATVDVTDIRIITLTSVPSEFQIQTLLSVPMTLVPTDGRQITVRCKPLAVGLRTAILRLITSNDDTLNIYLMVNGTTIQPDVLTIPSSIDFGVRLPGLVIDTIFKVVAVGPDSATIQNYSVANDNAAIYFDIVPDDPNKIFPVLLHVGDTLVFHARFHPGQPTSQYTGRADMQGIVSGTSLCEFIGRSGLPDIQASPQILDFGTIPLGSRSDSVIVIKDIGEVQARIQTISTPNLPFSIVKPSLPRIVRTADSIRISVSVFGSAVGNFSSPVDVLELSPGLTGVNKTLLMQVRVVPQVLTTSVLKSLDVVCGLDSVYTFSYTIRDTGAYSIFVDSLTSINPFINVPSAVFPDSLHPSLGKTVQIQYHYDGTSSQDSLLILVIKAYGRGLIFDTINLHSIERTERVTVANIATSGDNTFVVKTNANVEAYKLSKLQFILSLTPPDVAELFIDSIKTTDVGANIAFKNLGSGKYELLLSKTDLSYLSHFDSLITFGLKYFIAKDSIVKLTIETVSEEKSGCLTFVTDSMFILPPKKCGDDILRAGLRNDLLIDNFHFLANPVSDFVIKPIFDLHRDAMLQVELYNDRGIGVATFGYQQTASSEIYLPINVSSYAAGAYYMRIRATDQLGNHGAVSQPFIIKH